MESIPDDWDQVSQPNLEEETISCSSNEQGKPYITNILTTDPYLHGFLAGDFAKRSLSSVSSDWGFHFSKKNSAQLISHANVR